MSNRRPRRSRIYDLNYNIGENLYKSALDRLDEKSSRPASVLLRGSEPPRSRITQVVNDGGVLDDLELARDRASRAIQRETILDARTGRRGLEVDGDFDNQVQKTLERIQASKKLLSNIDVENGYGVNNELASSSATIKKRSVKIVSDISSSSALAQSNNEYSSKWSKSASEAVNDSESYAAARARQSAARLQDIEQDMIDRNERQFLRERRAANVKKLLAESSDLADDADYAASVNIKKTTQKRITSY